MKNKARFDAERGEKPAATKQHISPGVAPLALPDLKALLNEALTLHQANRLGEAEQVYRKILQVHSKHYDSLHLLGIIHLQRSEFNEALAHFDAVLKDNPKFSAAHNNRGNVLKELKRFDDALMSYDLALAINPDNADAYNNRGAVLYGLKRFPEALESCDKAIGLKSDHIQAYNNRANVLKALKRFNEALASCDAALKIAPDFIDAHNNRAVVLFEMRRFDESLASYDRALALNPDDAEIIKNRANVLARMKRFADAVKAYDKVTSLDSSQQYLEGLRLHAKLSACDWTDFEVDCQHLKAAVANEISATMPFTLLAISSDAELQLKCARRYIAERCSPVPTPLWRGERYSHQRIRVGYVSADLREHPVAVLTAGMFGKHDRSRFETIAISLGPEDRMTQRLRGSFDRFYDMQAMSDQDVAELMRDLEIDIAVDLNGFTEGSRQNIFSFRPAPVQVNYLGYAGTMGAEYWDYIVADRYVIPETQRAHYAEKVVYLPDTFMANDSGRKISDQVPSRAEAGLPERGFVFCCFNNNFKITPDIFDVWMRLLKQVDGSVLWLTAASPAAMENLSAEAAKRGVSNGRLVFAPRVDLNEDHLARHRLADLFLDTVNYNAHASASDALWSGVPVLTCAGGTFASRVAGSLLTSLGLEELITHSLSEYEALALKLAHEPASLAAVKHKLGHNRETFPLFNTERFTRNIEAAFVTMWERHQRGEAADGFSVGPQSAAPVAQVKVAPKQEIVVVPKAFAADLLGRFREVISDPLNLMIERVPQAGIVVGGDVILHNGNRVPMEGEGSYYDTFSHLLVMNRGVHEPLEEFIFQELLKALPDAPSMIELGAFWGHYSMWLKKVRPRASVIMVEPEEANLRAGKNNFNRNGFSGEFIQAFVGPGEFEVDVFFQSRGLTRLDVLHSDIQGHEAEMLEGAEKTLKALLVDYVFVSTHSQDIHDGVITDLNRLGYRVEISSDFSRDSTSHDGLVFASSPKAKQIFKNFPVFGRTRIAESSPGQILQVLLDVQKSVA